MALSLKPLGRYLRLVRRQFPPLNFITLHFLFFIGTCLLGAVIVWAAATPRGSISFTDSVFLAVSAMTETGLNTVNLSTLNTLQQVVLLLLILSGSAILVSAVVVRVRKGAFERKFRAVIEVQRQSEKDSSDASGTGQKSHDSTVIHQFTPNSGVGPRVCSEDALNSLPNLDLGDVPRLIKAKASRDPKQASRPNVLRPHHTDDTADMTYAHPWIWIDDQQTLPLPQAHHTERQNSSKPDLPITGRLRTNEGKSEDPQAAFAVKRLRSRIGPKQYLLSISRWISKESVTHRQKVQDRERLGGDEYRAVCMLAWLVPIYWLLWQLLGCLGCAAWVAYHRPDVTLLNGLNPWWVGAFKAVSAFNNSGMDLLDKNMIPFQDAYYLLMTMGLLILAGNTGYPLFLRFIIWCMYSLIEPLELRSEAWGRRVCTMRYLLKNPRRCYTLLFPAKQTWWLFISVVALNGIDWLAFGVLSIDNKTLASLPVGVKVIDGLFQALAVRSGGFYVVSVSDLHISLQLLYIVMMYISVYPLLMTVRTSNVYEKRTIGIYRRESSGRWAIVQKVPNPAEGEVREVSKLRTVLGYLMGDDSNDEESVNGIRFRRQLRHQLAQDVWWMIFALFCILIIEERQFKNDPSVFSVFNFMFEIVSAYGCVGISTGVPWQNYSFSGSWHTVSKLILCAVMLRGRHRGLPVAIDKAVLLPGEEHWNETSEANDYHSTLHPSV